MNTCAYKCASEEILPFRDGLDLHCAPRRHMSLVALCWFSSEICKNTTKNRDASYVYAWMNSLSCWVRPSAGSLGDCSVSFLPSKVQLQSTYVDRLDEFLISQIW